MSEAEHIDLQSACDQLIASHKTLLLATHSVDDGANHISYAPYVRDEDNFYIFVSELAKHTKNLMSHPQVSILFIQAESDADNLFARQRVTLDCQVEEIQKASPLYDHQLNVMTEKFGNIIHVLRTLPDFHLLALTPKNGQFVAGFGKAIPLDAKCRLQWSSSTD